MFDLGLSKLVVIGVVALVVIGPERLPKVARTAGALFGRAQRYINDVKAEVAREMDMGDLHDIKSEFERAAGRIENTIHDQLKREETDLNDAWTQGTRIEGEASASPASSDSYSFESEPSGALAGPAGVSAPSARGQRVNWRLKQAAPPLWYARAQARRRRVLSSAARRARYRSGGYDSLAGESIDSSDSSDVGPSRFF